MLPIGQSRPSFEVTFPVCTLLLLLPLLRSRHQVVVLETTCLFLFSFFLFLTGASSAFFTASLPHREREKETRWWERERKNIRIPVRGEIGGDEGRTVSTRNRSPGRRPSRVARISARRCLLLCWAKISSKMFLSLEADRFYQPILNLRYV